MPTGSKIEKLQDLWLHNFFLLLHDNTPFSFLTTCRSFAL
jgi:hypothetical protein